MLLGMRVGGPGHIFRWEFGSPLKWEFCATLLIFLLPKFELKLMKVLK